MLIREYAAADQAAVEELFRQNTVLPAEEIEQTLQNGPRFVAMQNDILVGFAALTPGMVGAYSFSVIVAPSPRRQGIGTALWGRLKPLLPADTWLVCVTCPHQNVDGHEFLKAMSFDPWFSEELMHYSGPAFPEPTLTARTYTDEDRHDWVRLINDGFYPIRHANDIRPHRVFADADDPATRERFLKSANDKFLFFDGEQLVGLSAVGGSEIDPITVVEGQRGKGYARQIMIYTTNLLLARGFDPVILRVLTTNTRARQLYLSLGYRLIEQGDYFRLRLA